MWTASGSGCHATYAGRCEFSLDANRSIHGDTESTDNMPVNTLWSNCHSVRSLKTLLALSAVSFCDPGI